MFLAYHTSKADSICIMFIEVIITGSQMFVYHIRFVSFIVRVCLQTTTFKIGFHFYLESGKIISVGMRNLNKV